MSHLTRGGRVWRVARKQQELLTTQLCRGAFFDDIATNHVSYGVRQNFSRDMADLFVDDIKKAYAALLAPKTKTIVKQRSPREAHPVS
jgi:hypothetical protein